VEEEIDLRPYVEAIIRHWYWIVGAALIGAIIGFVVSSFLPPTYEATALVAVIGARERLQFDARFQETTENQPLRAFPQLAESDQVLQRLLVENLIEDVETVAAIRGAVTAEVGDDLSIVQLTARSTEPALAADLANAWAAVFVEWANQIYGEQGGDQVRFFESQRDEALVALTAIEDALINYQGINQTQVISNTLVAYTDTQAGYLEAQRELLFLTQDVEQLRDRLAEQPDTNSITLADQLTSLSLQLQTYGANTTLPLLFQLNQELVLTGDSRAEQLVLLDSLLAALSLQANHLENELVAIEPRILALQQQVQLAETEYHRLLRDRTVAEETYTALARKVNEERIAAQDTTTGVRLASEAAVPQTPASPNKIFNAILLAGLGAFIGLSLVVFVQWHSSKR
jgi:uncharacterized protein involved in exopolysaccharide biosynthesis